MNEFENKDKLLLTDLKRVISTKKQQKILKKLEKRLKQNW